MTSFIKVAGDPKTRFFGMLFQARDEAHLLHLNTSSFAQHKALNKFYDEILELTDTLMESYQGIYGLQSITISESSTNKLPLNFLEALYKTIDTTRIIFTESWLQNIIDEIQQLIAQTLYKIKYLK